MSSERYLPQFANFSPSFLSEELQGHITDRLPSDSVAKNREWFTEYTPFESVLGDILRIPNNRNGLRVQGVGTVELLTKKSPNATGRKSHRTIRLTNVVHAPTALCNIIGRPILDDYNVISEDRNGSQGRISDREGRSVAYFDPSHPLLAVKLRGPPVGPPAIRKGDLVVINALWSREERERWEEYDRRQHRDRPYTTEEKKWLKVHYGGEFHFLMAYGLSIYKDKDREEGRTIVRGFMREEGPEGRDFVQALTGESDNETDTTDDPMESCDWQGYAAGFDEEQLQWIEENYGNSENFMRSFGLKFFEEEDCAEAKAILRGFMSVDD